MNTLYLKGETIMDKTKIVLEINDKQIINPTHEMLIENGWEIYKQPETLIDELKISKENKKLEILNYDSSENVNSFMIGEYNVWLDKSTRTGLMLRFQAEQAISRETTTLWYDNIQFELPINTAIMMLYSLELYASACYDNTHAHLAKVEALKTVEEVESYDFTTGYPEKLKF